MLGKLAGRTFRLSASGGQAGRDLTSDPAGGTVIAVESKRYRDKTELDERELLGEMSQARRDRPDLDLWVLVTSRPVRQQLHQALSKEAADQGLEFRSVGTGDGDPSSLQILYATDVDIVLSFLRHAGRVSEGECKRVQRELTVVRRRTDFETLEAGLRNAFSDASIGYDHWRSRQADELGKSFRIPDRSRQVFEGQLITVAAPAASLLERGSSLRDLDEWWSHWSEERKAKVVLGEEGHGKTWAIAAWIARHPATLPAVFINARAANSPNPDQLLAAAVSSLFTDADKEKWRLRFTRWAKHRVAAHPSVLLVLDGINECHEPAWWRKLIDGLQTEPWSSAVATIITCRTLHWRQHFAPLSHLRYSESTVGPFTEQELDDALTLHGLKRDDFPSDLVQLLRRPRYLTMAVKYRTRVTEAGDFTVPRLLYEDAKDRYQAKLGPLDDQSFQGILTELARKAWARERVTPSDVARLFPPHVKPDEALTELITGGVLETQGGRTTIVKDRLPLALGLLLADEVRDAAKDGTRPLMDVIQGWLEPEAGMPLKAGICEHAALHALNSVAFEDDVCVALLDAWAQLQNAPGRDDGFPAYFPCRPEAYFTLAEQRWADVEHRVAIHRLLMNTFLHWRANPHVRGALVNRFERWLGFVHPAGYRALYGAEPPELEKGRDEIEARVGFPLHQGRVAVAGYELTVIDHPGLLRLARAALAVISHVPRQPFVRALVMGAVAEQVMGSPEKFDEFRWTCSAGPDPLFDAFKPHIDSLLAQTSVVARRAAHRLLTYVGTDAALELRQSLPSDLFPASPWRDQDPCAGLPWWREHCASCSARDDIKVSIAVRAVAPHAVDPELRVDDRLVERLDEFARTLPGPDRWTHTSTTFEDHLIEAAEPTYCAFRPESFARAIRQMAREAQSRDGVPLRSLLWGIRGHELIFTREEWAALRTAWERMLRNEQAWQEVDRHLEESLFDVLLLGLGPDEQLRLLLQRPDRAGDLVAFEARFGWPPDWNHVKDVLACVDAAATLRRLLWFIAGRATEVPTEVVRLVAPLSRHGDSLVRACALKVILDAGTEDQVRQVVDGGWRAGDRDDNYVENHWGTWLLIDRAKWLSLEELRDRIPGSFHADAVEQRGHLLPDLVSYGQWLDKALLPHASLPVTVQLRRKEDRDRRAVFRPGALPSEEPPQVLRSRASTWGDAAAATADQYSEAFDWERREQDAAARLELAQRAAARVRNGNLGLIDSPSRSVLEMLLIAVPDLMDRWLGVALSDKAEDRLRVANQPAFFQDFCAVLMKISPARGVGLYKRLRARSFHAVVDSCTRISSLDLALWAARAGPEIDSLRRELVAGATSDAELARIAFAAEHGDNLRSLQALIQEGRRSPRLIDQARALTLEHLVCDPSPSGTASANGAFLREVEHSAFRWSRSNRYARYWYGAFLSAASDLRAWAALRLFLRCVDRRFWLWHSALEQQAGEQAARRLVFARALKHKIEGAIKKNEETLQGTLVGMKVLDSGTWPWMETRDN